MPSSPNRTPSAFAPEYVARFVGDPPALETVRAAGRLLAEQTAHRPGPASADVCSRLRLQLAAGGVADVAEFLAQLGDGDFVGDLVAQGAAAAGWRYDGGAECAVALSEVAEQLHRFGLPPAVDALAAFERRRRERLALEAEAIGAEPPEPRPVPTPPATDRAQHALSELAASVRALVPRLRAASAALDGAPEDSLAFALAGELDGVLRDTLPALVESAERHAAAAAAVPEVDAERLEALAREFAGGGQ